MTQARQKIRSALFLLIGGALVLAGCKAKPTLPPLVETVAVLPFDNESNDVDAADIMQRYVYLALKNSVYRVSDVQTVNDKLKEAGISEGGQLGALDPVKIGQDLGVQGLLYGYVESFGYLNIGFYTQKKVTLQLKMVDAATGATLWENSQTGATRNMTLDPEQGSMAAKLFPKRI